MPAAELSKSAGPAKPLRGTAKTPYRYTANLPNEGILMVEALGRRPWWKEVAKAGVFNFWWGPNGERFNFKTKITPGTRQLVNRIEDHKEICTKNNLAKNLISYARKNRLDVSDKCGIPTTIILNSGGPEGIKLLASNMAEFKKAAKDMTDAGKENKHLSGDIWIVKPAGRNRGIGIEVLKGFKDVEQFIKKQTTSSQWVVQKYLEDPMLIHNCKFDIRQLILVTQDREVFMYSNSYVRTSSTEYTKDTMDRAVHLVNDYVQKHEENYGKFEDANKLSFDQFRAIMKSHGKSFDDDIYPQMLEITRNLFRAALDKLNPRRTDYCFELMGMDFMLDSSFKVWLIEINTSPALFRHGQVLVDMMPSMIEEVVQKTVDKVFPPPEGVELPRPLNGFERLVF